MTNQETQLKLFYIIYSFVFLVPFVLKSRRIAISSIVCTLTK
jgi:hypothetical protein